MLTLCHYTLPAPLKFMEFTSCYIVSSQKFKMLWSMSPVTFQLTYITPVLKKQLQTVTIYISHVCWGGAQPNLSHTTAILTELSSVFFPQPLGANDKTVSHIRPQPLPVAYPLIRYSLIIVPFHRTVSAADCVIKYSIIEFKNSWLLPPQKRMG